MNPAPALLILGFLLVFYKRNPIFYRAAYISVSYADLFASRSYAPQCTSQFAIPGSVNIIPTSATESLLYHRAVNGVFLNGVSGYPGH